MAVDSTKEEVVSESSRRARRKEMIEQIKSNAKKEVGLTVKVLKIAFYVFSFLLFAFILRYILIAFKLLPDRDLIDESISSHNIKVDKSDVKTQ